MKKKFNLVFAFILLNAFHSFAQSEGVGINNPQPKTDLDIVGTMRLEHYTQAEGKVLVANQSGDVRWTAPFTLKFNLVELPNRGINISGVGSRYTGISIKLRPGGFLIKTILLLNNSGGLLEENQSTFVTVYLSDRSGGDTVPEGSEQFSADYIPGSAKEISGSLVGPSRYGLIDGSVSIRNNSNVEKTYYLWAKKEDFTDTSTLPTRRAVNINDLGSKNWGENIIYSIPIE